MAVLLSVVFALVVLFVSGCHQGMPQTQHSVIEIQGRKCEMTRALVQNGRNSDFAYSYNCDPPLAPGEMAAMGYYSPTLPVTRAQAALYNQRLMYNPPAQVCQDIQYKEDGQPKLTLPMCVDEETVQYMEKKPLPHATRARSAR